MKRMFILPFVALSLGCLPVQEPKQIVVEGEASVEAIPDEFDVSASIQSRSASREGALSEVAAIYAILKEQLPQLGGLEEINISTSNATLGPTYDNDCLENSYNGDNCPITGYRGSISVSVEGSPTSVAGSMLSLVAELGATSVELDAFRVSNIASFQREALKVAVENARKKADLIAGASGTTIVGTSKIQSSKGFNEDYFDADDDTIVVTASRVRAPRIALNIEPQPVTIRAKVAAAFEIE